MVRGIASVANPLKLLMFLVGILLATTIVLAIIGFWTIKNEELIAERDSENAKINLKGAIIQSSKRETDAIIKEFQATSLYEDFLQGRMPAGVLSVFDFKNGALIYPNINEDSKNEIYMLDSNDALELKEFLDLLEAKMFTDARKYALEKVDFFMQNPSIARLDWDSYFLTRMLDSILQEQNLPKEEKKRIEKISGETKIFLQNLDTYSNHRDFLLALGKYAGYSTGGHFFIKDRGDIFLVISHLEPSVKKSTVAKVDSAFYSNRIYEAIKDTAKVWGRIPYSISGSFPYGELNILTEENIIIEDELITIKKESRKKIIFLCVMLALALIIPIIGFVFIYKVYSKERQLRLMKDNFLSTVSHELKTPLTSIKIYSELINSGRIKEPEKIVSRTGVILKETNRLESLIEAILDYTRMESGKKVFRWENINLSECVEKVCNALDAIANSKGLEIKRELETGCAITGDYPSIYSLVQNLVDNAIKYTAKGYVLVKLQRGAQDISLSVEDTGKGIPADEQKNIFEGFYRVGDESTRETKGSGLGLAIVKRTADAHKAEILLKSELGKGSVFTVVFKGNASTNAAY